MHARSVEHLVDGGGERVRQLDRAPGFVRWDGPGVVVGLLTRGLGAVRSTGEFGVEVSGLDKRAPELMPRAAVALRLHLALAQRSAHGVQHRAVGRAQGCGRVLVHYRRRRSQTTPRRRKELS